MRSDSETIINKLMDELKLVVEANNELKEENCQLKKELEKAMDMLTRDII